MSKVFSNVIGFDDGPFDKNREVRVKVVGTVFAGLRLDGVLVADIEKDGSDATDCLTRLIRESRFAEHAQLIMLQGITLGGFNVVDVNRLHELLDLPVLCVARKRPDMPAIRAALRKIPEGDGKWRLIEGLAPMEGANGIYLQRVGLSRAEAIATVRRFAVHSLIPEPIRAAHLIAGALVEGQSRGSV